MSYVILIYGCKIMIIQGIYHIFGNDDKAKKAIKNAKLEGYVKKERIDEFIKNNQDLNVTKIQAECF